MRLRSDSKKKVLMFGDFIAGAYRTWGRRRAKGLVWLAINTRLVEFGGRQRFVISKE